MFQITLVKLIVEPAAAEAIVTGSLVPFVLTVVEPLATTAARLHAPGSSPCWCW